VLLSEGLLLRELGGVQVFVGASKLLEFVGHERVLMLKVSCPSAELSFRGLLFCDSIMELAFVRLGSLVLLG
jgi:hypothetical protein